MSDAIDDPRGEAAAIARGLASHLRRRRALGERRTTSPALAAAKPAPAAPPAPVEAPKPPRRPPQLFAELTPHEFSPAASPRPAPEPRLSPAIEAVRVTANRVRERALACADLESLRTAVAGCTECGLCRTRTQTVFADGTARHRLMFIGEAPGESEDLQGVPFVGKAGQLLTDIITKGMRVARADVYIANVLKCRPPENRDPTDVEKALCTPWLDRQIELVDPAVIVALGRHAANHVLGHEGARALSMGALRGKVHERGGRKVVATFHPAYLLRSPGEKKECWKDIQVAMRLAGLAVEQQPPSA